MMDYVVVVLALASWFALEWAFTVWLGKSDDSCKAVKEIYGKHLEEQSETICKLRTRNAELVIQFNDLQKTLNATRELVLDARKENFDLHTHLNRVKAITEDMGRDLEKARELETKLQLIKEIIEGSK